MVTLLFTPLLALRKYTPGHFLLLKLGSSYLENQNMIETNRFQILNPDILRVLSY